MRTTGIRDRAIGTLADSGINCMVCQGEDIRFIRTLRIWAIDIGGGAIRARDRALGFTCDRMALEYARAYRELILCPVEKPALTYPPCPPFP